MDTTRDKAMMSFVPYLKITTNYKQILYILTRRLVMIFLFEGVNAFVTMKKRLLFIVV